MIVAVRTCRLDIVVYAVFNEQQSPNIPSRIEQAPFGDSHWECNLRPAVNQIRLTLSDLQC
jgi:hypothetical protein